MYKTKSRFLQKMASIGAKKSTGSNEIPKKPPIPKNIINAFASKTLIKGNFEIKIKDGYRFNYNNFPMFCPDSEIYPNSLTKSELTKLYDSPLELEVIKIDFELNSVIVSRKRAVQKLGLGKVKSTSSHGRILIGTVKKFNKIALEKIKPTSSQDRTILGIVKFFKKNEIFVDIGDIDDLLHISNISERHIDNISNYFKPGQKVTINIIKIDKENNRITLSMRSDR